jgi:hypothetical protein
MSHQTRLDPIPSRTTPQASDSCSTMNSPKPPRIRIEIDAPGSRGWVADAVKGHSTSCGGLRTRGWEAPATPRPAPDRDVARWDHAAAAGPRCGLERVRLRAARTRQVKTRPALWPCSESSCEAPIYGPGPPPRPFASPRARGSERGEHQQGGRGWAAGGYARHNLDRRITGGAQLHLGGQRRSADGALDQAEEIDLVLSMGKRSPAAHRRIPAMAAKRLAQIGARCVHSRS